jgi:hypothetical protein
MFSSNSTVQYGQFGTMPNALGLSSQSSSIVLTANSGGQEPTVQNENIFLCFANGTKAHVINKNGQIILNANNPDFTGSTYGGDDGGVGNVIQSNGASGLIWAPSGGFSSYWNVFYDNGQQTVKTNSNIILYQRIDQYNILPNLRMLFKCIFNFSVSSPNPLLTLSLIRIQGVVETNLQTFTQMLSRTGHHNYPVNFDWVMDSDYSISFKVVATVSSGSIATDANDYYSVTVDEIRANAS